MDRGGKKREERGEFTEKGKEVPRRSEEWNHASGERALMRGEGKGVFPLLKRGKKERRLSSCRR